MIVAKKDFSLATIFGLAERARADAFAKKARGTERMEKPTEHPNGSLG